ncbi:MAG: Cys-tRNA(Pro) deacylase [Odoribacter sp.]
MKPKINKTNAARLLDQAKINYQLVAYEIDENNLAATHVAQQLGENIEQVFKTIVLRGDKTGIFVCLIPGDKEINLKRAAQTSGNKNAATLHLKELLPTTGYIRGGCSPIGMKKTFPTFLHSSCLLQPYLYISAGIRGLQIKIDPAALIKATGAKVTELLTEPTENN